MVGNKMRSHLLIWFFVGLAIAQQNNPAWKSKTEYTYEIHGRSFASFNGLSDEYTGIVLRAKLLVQPQGSDKLRCRLTQPEYAEIQTKLPEGWMSKLPEGKLSYRPLKMTDKPFEVVLKNGVVKDLIVEKEISQWEANIIKSMVSQFQLDTKAENLVPSSLNVLPKEGFNNAVFKTLEDTVTGITETTYDIHPMPEYILQAEPHLAPFPHLKGDGSIIEIVKSKNFTEGQKLPAYFTNLGKSGQWRPTGNQWGSIIHRNSLSRAVVTGTLQRFTIQYSETSNENIISLKNFNEGSVNSMMRIKLVNAEQQTSQLPELTSPVHTGSLVYRYQKEDNEGRVSEVKIFEALNYMSGIDDNGSQEYHQLKRHPRSLSVDSQSYEENSIESEEEWTIPKPKLSQSPYAPMLPMSVGYKGRSLRHAPGINLIEKVTGIAERIASDLENPQEMQKKNTLARFITLTSVLRIMNEQELKQAAQRLYTKETEGHKYNSWVIFRDSLAETGTGPAFLLIKHYIESHKIQGLEAAALISSIGSAVRQPTEEYMKAFFELTKKQIQDTQDKSMLNETMLFTFSELVHNVYVNKNYSHREYPTHVYGKFYTSSGRSFVRNEVIPYLTEQLKTSISNGDSHKINVYIRALGQIGERQIIYAFQPYLEGKVQCSQFQRLLMVLSLRQVAEVYPKTVGALLYRIYQNIGETTEIRVASVYMIMHTAPSVDMLQRIAKYTKIESNHRVSAAVKSAIRSVASLNGREFSHLRSAAESASHYLTERDFGVYDSQDILKSYTFHSWESYYKNVLQTIVSEESGMPTSMYAAFEGKGNEIKFKSFTFESVVSDIRNFIQVLQKKTHWHREEQKKQQSYQQSEQSAWSSPNIARLLNLQTEELEQLEGLIYVKLGEFKKHLIFDNQTIENLPETIEHLLSSLENGKKFEYTKLINNKDGSIAYPTEIGLPFLINYEVPVLVNIKGSVKAKSQPQMVSNGEFIAPEKIEMNGEFRVTLSVKQQLKFGFFAPFSHQQYFAGRTDDAQVYLPIKTVMSADLRNDKFHFELEPLKTEENIDIFQLTTAPYITKQDILDLNAAADKKNVHVIHKPIVTRWDHTVGDKSVGMAFHVKYESEEKYTSLSDFIAGLFELTTHYEHLRIQFVPEKSRNYKLTSDFVYKQENHKVGQDKDGKTLLSEISQLPTSQEQRVPEIMKHAPAGIQNARLQALDSWVRFTGQQNVEYILSVAYARNQEDSESRMLAYFKKQSQSSRPFAAALAMKFDMARVNGLDMEYLMDKDLESSVYIDGAFAETLPTDNQFEIQAKLKRSDARKQYLMEQPFYHKCQREAKQGNKQLLSCANMTQMAGLLDSLSIKMKYPKLSSKDLHTVLMAYNSYVTGHPFDIETKQHKQKQGEISVNVQYSPDLERANISVYSRDTQAYMKNKEIDPWTRPIVVPHPIFNVVDRVAGKMYGLKTYKPICTMDKSEGYTYDGYEYPLSLSNFWTVLMQYVPLRSSDDSYSSVEEQLKHEFENYVVLAKSSSQGSEYKDVKILVSTPKTQGKIIEINLKPRSSGESPQVFVNEKQVTVKQNGDSETYYDQVTVLGLPHGEVYVRVHDDFYVIYDGTRVKITSLGVKLRNRVRGLCGNFNGYSTDDLTTASNCVVRDPKELIASYTVLKDGEYSPEVTEYKRKTQNNRCVHKKVPLYVKYINSEEENMDFSHHSSSHETTSSCMKFQTRYVVENGQICFTIRPLNVCRPECREENTVYKGVEVHCVQNRNVASLWKSQIDKGASPDFSQKPVTKTVQLQVPHSCRSA